MENETRKFLWAFEIQTDPQISAWRPDLVIVNKIRELTELWALLSRLTTKKYKYLNLSEVIEKKLWNIKVKVITIELVHLVQSPNDWLKDWETYI